jgi:hypothetical protein
MRIQEKTNKSFERTAAMPAGEVICMYGVFPQPSYSQRADQSLTVSERVLLNEYLSKLERIYTKIGIAVSKISIDAPPDPEEGTRSILVTSHFDVDMDTAFSYWDMIGNEFDSWESVPDEHTASDVLDLISTRVRWRK